MAGIVSRLLVRVAIVLASLAWAGYVFTHTVGDPGRGERIASAVLADADARAEIVDPIAASVMNTSGLPAEQRPLVERQVELLLADPVGARSFIDPFAGSWARLLGEDDRRPAEFDLAPVLTRVVPPAAVGSIDVPERLPVNGVPLPRTQLGWLGDVRSAIETAVLPLASAAAALFAVAFLVGDRARVLRRLGIWAILAGLSWVALPPVLVWLARRWAPGADAVVAVALDEAVSGLFLAALALVIGGGSALAASFAVRPAHQPARTPAARAPAAREPRRSPRHGGAPTRAPGPARRSAPARQRTVAATAEMPAVSRVARTAGRASGSTSHAEPTVAMPVTGPAGNDARDERTDDDGDALWEYYSSQPR